MLKQVCAYMAGKENKLATLKQMADSVKIMLAGKKSQVNGGTIENIADLKDDDPCFDGAAFEVFYAESQRK